MKFFLLSVALYGACAGYAFAMDDNGGGGGGRAARVHGADSGESEAELVDAAGAGAAGEVSDEAGSEKDAAFEAVVQPPSTGLNWLAGFVKRTADNWHGHDVNVLYELRCHGFDASNMVHADHRIDHAIKELIRKSDRKQLSELLHMCKEQKIHVPETGSNFALTFFRKLKKEQMEKAHEQFQQAAVEIRASKEDEVFLVALRARDDECSDGEYNDECIFQKMMKKKRGKGKARKER